MSKNTYLTKSKVAAGAALVALSGVVPAPIIVQEAHADTATISVTGKFVSGITLAAGTNVKLGSMVVSASTGVLGIDGAAVTNKVAGSFLGTPAAGTIQITAKAILPIDIKVAGFGTVTLTGGTATGTVTINKIEMSAAITAATTIVGGVGTPTATVTGVNLNTSASATAPATFNIGATVVWNGNRPRGTFTQPMVFTITF